MTGALGEAQVGGTRREVFPAAGAGALAPQGQLAGFRHRDLRRRGHPPAQGL